MPRWGDHPVVFDRSDTLHSAMSKLEGATDPALVVVIESACRVADNVLLYRMMARSSQHLRVPVAVVSQNPLWRKLAREHGLNAYATMGSVKRARRNSAISLSESLADSVYSSLLPSVAGHGKAIAAMLVLALLLTLGLGYYFLPVMTVTVRTPVEDFTSQVSLRVDAASTSLDDKNGVIPGRVVQHRFTASDFADATGKKPAGKDQARGEITVINSSSATIDLPSGTVVLANNGQKFTTAERVRVGAFSGLPTRTPDERRSGTPTPAPATEPRAVGVIVNVPVVAVDAGEAGNVPALSINKFQSGALSGLTVFNERPSTGGSNQEVSLVTREDRDRLKEMLFQRAQSQALAELQVRLRKSESLIPHSMQVSIEREEFDKEQDEEAKQVKGVVHVLATAIAFANPDLNSYVQATWEKSVPRGYSPVPGGFQLAPPEVVDAGPRSAEIRVKVTGKIEGLLQSDELARSLRGLTVREASGKLAEMSMPLQNVNIELWPDWASRAYRLDVKSAR